MTLMQATQSTSQAGERTQFTRKQLEKKVALCYFKRRVTMNESDHMAASMPTEDFNELYVMCGQAFEMGPRESDDI